MRSLTPSPKPRRLGRALLVCASRILALSAIAAAVACSPTRDTVPTATKAPTLTAPDATAANPTAAATDRATAAIPTPTPTQAATATTEAPPISPLPASPLPAPTSGFGAESPLSPQQPAAPEEGATPVYGYRVLAVYPHDTNAFTQGLVISDDVLYEGTGLRQQSTLRKVDLETGDVLQSLELLPNYFGEGITVFEDKIIQLTLESYTGFVYDKDSFELLREFYYPTKGWGITHDGERLIMSDGSDTLRFLDPETFREIGRVEVHDDKGPVVWLNELEYINGEVYANVWSLNRIARIDPSTGRVTAWVDLEGLLQPDELANVDVFNGIAYDAQNDRLFVTGKWWPKLFEIEIIPSDR